MTPRTFRFIAETSRQYKNFNIKLKSEVWWMRALGTFLKIVTFGSQKTFMTSYITTIGHTIYVPDGWDDWDEDNRIEVLRHERVHMDQADRYTLPLFALLYIFTPLPLFLAYFRAKFEREAYKESLAAIYEMRPERLDMPGLRDWYISQFTSGAYGWMWPFRKTISRWYDEDVWAVKSGAKKQPSP